jgi:hypothetical protein
MRLTDASRGMISVTWTRNRSSPKAYTRPLTYVQHQALLPDTDLLEYICAEHAKPIGGVR